MGHPNLDLQNKTAVVIGGTSGIGLEIAKGLAIAGADVVATGRRSELVRSATAAIESLGRRSLSLTSDVTDQSSLKNLLDATCGALGSVQILVNSAGRTKKTPSLAVSSEEWNGIVETNLTGTLRSCQVFGRHMIERGYGRIVNIASVAGLVGSGGGAAYTASKHGVVGLTRQLAITYAGRGITVNAICPGAIQTGLRDNSTRILGADAPVMRGVGGDEAAVRAITPAGRRGTLEEIAAAACYLASSEADYVTGSTLVVDGGWTAK